MAESKEIMRQLAGFVATSMTEQSGMEWKVNPDRNPAAVGAYIYQVETGAEIFVRPDRHGNPDRAVFESSFPDGTLRQVHPDPKEFRTTVDRHRDPSQVAAQVLRKVAIPEFFSEYKRCTARLGQDATMVDVRGEVANRLVQAFRPHWVSARISDDTPEASQRTVSWWRHGDSPIHADAWINYRADEVKLTLEDLTPDQAVKVMELLGTFYN